MLLWINGPFGGGKTQTAHEIQRRLPGSVICDPEEVSRAGPSSGPSVQARCNSGRWACSDSADMVPVQPGMTSLSMVTRKPIGWRTSARRSCHRPPILLCGLAYMSYVAGSPT
jgi:hypothetical protein